MERWRKGKLENSNYIFKFFPFPLSAAFPKHEYSWELLEKIIFNMRLKLWHLHFAFCQHKILKKEEKEIVFNFDSNAPEWKLCCKNILIYAVRCAGNFRVGISHSPKKKNIKSHIESEKIVSKPLASFSISIIHSTIIEKDLILMRIATLWKYPNFYNFTSQHSLLS